MKKLVTNSSGLWVPPNANVVNHTHLDCVNRHDDVVRMAAEVGFERFEEPFPELTVKLYRAAELLGQVGGREYHDLARKLYRRANAAYRDDCFGRVGDLTRYVAVIRDQIVPLMQNRKNLEIITRHYIEDLVADNTIGAQIRFAPYYHIQGGLSLDEVMDAVIGASSTSPIPIKWILCVLRHDTPEVARLIADLSVRWSEHVGAMDLAGAEALNPGVIPWWFEQALRAREESAGKVEVTLHLGEVHPATAEDIALLKRNKVRCVGHFLYNDDPDLYQEVCPDSNVYIGADPSIKHFRDHNINRKLREGQHVMLSTDGTLLIPTSMRKQIQKGRQQFKWTNREIYQMQQHAVDGGYYDPADKERMKLQLKLSYGISD